ncbi:helix-turn-helix domain-containing protein [Alcaligenaceae bacterium]|nr:helix-turn-helix domain-containing protein [Alcaligenaceae bacterium]
MDKSSEANTSEFRPIRQACELLGSATNLAKQLGVSPVTINQWALKQRPVPIIRCVQIEELTNGAVTRKQLRPDDWSQIWPELREID